MTSFEAGFIKYAEECGLAPEAAAHVFKRAMEHPAAQNMFKELPEDQNESHEDISVLAELLKQDLIDQQMTAGSKQIAV